MGVLRGAHDDAFVLYRAFVLRVLQRVRVQADGRWTTAFRRMVAHDDDTLLMIARQKCKSWDFGGGA
jgi:hypothetical protein